MANHIKSAHFGETLTYTCTLCDFGSASRRQLTNHRKECHGLGVGGANSSVVGVKIEPGTLATVATPVVNNSPAVVSLPTQPVSVSLPTQPVVSLPTQPLPLQNVVEQQHQTQQLQINGQQASIVALGPDGTNVLVPVSMASSIVLEEKDAKGETTLTYIEEPAAAVTEEAAGNVTVTTKEEAS